MATDAKFPAGLALYLDLVRVAAALAVLLSHVLPVFGVGKLFPAYGHDAVVVFFVLSGFVIAYACDRKDATFFDYALSRLVRLWSVAAPALILGMVLWASLPSPGGASATSWSLRGAAGSSLANLFFLGESWAGERLPPFNGPFWSLNYEAWYYAIYAAFIFTPGRRRWPVTLLVCALAGPAVMALAPCWFAGVALYHWRARLQMSGATAAGVFVLSLIGYAAIGYYELADWSRAWLKQATAGQSYHLGASQGLIADFLLAAVVVANFAAAASLPPIGSVLLPVRRMVVGAASFTLSIYLYHSPLLALFQGRLGIDPSAGTTGLIFALLLLAPSILALGLITEQKRHWLRSRAHAALMRRTPSWADTSGA